MWIRFTDSTVVHVRVEKEIGFKMIRGTIIGVPYDSKPLGVIVLRAFPHGTVLDCFVDLSLDFEKETEKDLPSMW